MDRLPRDFADLLTPLGRRVLDRGDPALARALARERLVYAEGLVDRRRAAAMRDLLERRLAAVLVPMARAIPPESIRNQTRDAVERLIKTVRVRTATFENPRAAATRAAARLGLLALLGSPALRRLAERLSGRALDPANGAQVLRYGPGDYSGPHTDHTPENARAAGGYLDVHLSLAGPGAGQTLVWDGGDGHMSRAVPVGTCGGLAIYRLPFWHYTTPLVRGPGGRPAAGAGTKPFRWVALATFFYAGSNRRVAER
jgi:hypothetical protein